MFQQDTTALAKWIAKRNPKRLRSIIHFGVDDVIRYSRLLAHLFSSSLVIRSPLIFRLASHNSISYVALSAF